MEISREELNNFYIKLLNVTHHEILNCDIIKLQHDRCTCGLHDMIEKISNFLSKFKDQNYYK